LRCTFANAALLPCQLIHQRKNLEYFLGHNAVEAPLALQLGGNSIEDLGGESIHRCAW
jgi:hypothetical protein